MHPIGAKKREKKKEKKKKKKRGSLYINGDLTRTPSPQKAGEGWLQV